MKKVLFISIFTLASALSWSQILVDQNYTIQEYVNNVLLGNGVTANNIQFTGCIKQLGHMTGGSSVGFTFDGGLVLSSDNAYSITQPPAADSSLFSVLDCPTSTTDNGGSLLSVANSVPGLIGQSFSVQDVNDVAILEFDFVPTGDTLQFNYIFGSDEYLTWVNTQYNDVFAFFLSGPGINGPYWSPAGFPNGSINIAALPNSNPPLPITISSVNTTTNPTYFINNPLDFTTNTRPNDIDINGFTVTLTAMAVVQCGLTYHIRLAIADGTDTALESIVMLEEGSFSSNAVVDVNLDINVGQPDANIIYEDCGEAVITFTRAPASDPSATDMIELTWGGTATMGIDYDFMPSEVIFLPGEMSHSFSIDAFEDGISETTESVIVEILNLAACNGSGITSYFTFAIGDEPLPLTVDGTIETICSGETLTLEPIINGGYGNYAYSWSTGETSSTIDVSPAATSNYFLTVSDTCSMPSDQGDFTVNVLVVPPLTISIDPILTFPFANDTLTISCLSGGLNVTAVGAGGDGNLGYTWTDENGSNLWGWGNSVWYDPSWNGDGEIHVTLTDGCGLTAEDSIFVEFPPVVFTVPAVFQANCIDPINVSTTIVTGGGSYSYNWQYPIGTTISNSTTLNYIFTQNSTAAVTVSDVCGASSTEYFDVQMVNPPLILELGADINASCVDTTVVSATTLSGSGIINYQWFAGGIPQAINSANFSYQSNVTIPIVVNGIDQCGMVDSDTTTIVIPNIPIVLTTSNDTSICYMADAHLFAQATGGEGVFNYYWPDLDENGQNQNLNDVMGSHTYTVVVTEICGHVLIDTIHVEVVPVSAVFQFNELAENLFEFLPDSCQNCLYAWDFGDGTTSSDVVVQHQFDGLEQYEVNLTVTNEIGCVDQGTYTVIAPPLYYVPSAFTPNSDGVNDAFGLVGENIDEFDLKIFNRWGDIVFHSIDPKDHWMGDYQGQADYYVPNGIYPFVIEMKGYDFGSKIIKGTILLNR